MEEEPKPAESTATEILPIPPSSAEVLPPQPPPSSLPPKSKKRPLENDAHFSNSSTLYKIRAVLKEVRPHFLERLQIWSPHKILPKRNDVKSATL